MAEGILDTDFLFSNFDSPNESEGEVSSKLKNLRKNKLLKPDYLATPEEPVQNTNSQDQYISELEEQNAKLKGIIKRMMGPQVFSVNDERNINDDDTRNEINLLEKLSNEIQEKPFAIVLFLNNDVSSVHRKEIDEAMRNVSAKQSTQDVLMAQKLQPQISAVPVKAFAANCKGRRSNLPKVKNSHEHYVICSCQYYKGFFIDRMGAPLLEDNPGVTDIWDVPSYPQMFLKALPIVEESLNIRVRQLKQCFNCGGEHHLENCTEPRDNERIKRNRMEHSASKFKSPAGFKNQGSDEVDERFKHFKAGEISVGLEEALGVSLKKELPPYIYKMRLMGYPPGWLIPLDEGGLKVYNADGDALQDPGYEEGEIKPIKFPDMVNYPGFNAPLPDGVRDSCDVMNMPPFRPDLVEMDVNRRKTLVLGYDPSEPIAKKLKYDEEDSHSDMEVEDQYAVGDDGKPPLPLIETSDDIKKPPPPPEDEKKNKKNKTQRSKSKKKKDEKTKKIDEKTYRNWYSDKPLSSGGIVYVILTPPPTCRAEVNLSDLPKNPVTDIDREPWKTSNASWYDPLYGDLAVPIGTYDNIRTILKENKTLSRRKSML